MKNILVPIAALGLLVACGDTATNEAQSSEAQLATTTDAQNSNEPQVGDRIPEPSRNLENSNRLAEAGAAANDAASRGVREIGWEELLPEGEEERLAQLYQQQMAMLYSGGPIAEGSRSEEHTSELQSPCNLVCRLLLEKKKKQQTNKHL